MNIFHVSSEVFPYSKTGGLADMTAALAKAQAGAGHEVTLVTPLYRGICDQFEGIKPSDTQLSVPLGQAKKTATVWTHNPAENLTILFVDQPELFDRANVYGEDDDAERFIFFSKAAARLAKRAEIVHAHDWQSALTMPLLSLGQAQIGTVFTIHNAAYQGRFGRDKFELTGLPDSFFNWQQLEFYDDINLLKGGVVFADLATTVSPRYAEELLTAKYGCGLEGVFQAKGSALTGVLNGVDYSEWNTTTNPHLAAPFSADAPQDKAHNKAALQRELGLAEAPEAPLFGNISRFVEQKGIDIMLEALEQQLSDEETFQFAGLGSGDTLLEQAMSDLAKRHPGRVAVRIGYDTALAHRIEAGCDFFIMPSRFEPCGLNQLYSLRYGAIPIARETGGLKDSIIDLSQGDDTATGIKFEQPNADALGQAHGQALALYYDRHPRVRVRDNGMRADFSWSRTTAEYNRLYDSVLP